ncbi:hypothetical protein ONZ45_g13095 [Pleurotus djamor]|nr:hypothetical protein ONZ45_g13095 [Pleurotus djamor]
MDSHPLPHTSSGSRKRRLASSKNTSSKRQRRAADEFSGFYSFLQSSSFSVDPPKHHPRIAENATALEELTDPAKNDVLAHVGCATHAVHVADTLYSLLFVVSPSNSDALDPNDSVMERFSRLNSDVQAAVFELLTSLYTKDKTLGHVESQVSNTPPPTTTKELKIAADAYTAKIWFSSTRYGWETVAVPYADLITTTLPSAMNDLDALAPSLDSRHYLFTLNSQLSGEFNKVKPAHEEEVLDLMRTKAYKLVHLPLEQLKIPADDEPIQWTSAHQVVGSCRPLVTLGLVLYRSALATQCDQLFPSHRSAKKGGSELRAAISRLAGSKGVMSLCARWAGLDKCGQKMLAGDKLPLIFLVAIAKLWLRGDRMKYFQLMDDITQPAVWHANRVLHAAGIRFDVIIPADVGVGVKNAEVKNTVSTN